MKFSLKTTFNILATATLMCLMSCNSQTWLDKKKKSTKPSTLFTPSEETLSSDHGDSSDIESDKIMPLDISRKETGSEEKVFQLPKRITRATNRDKLPFYHSFLKDEHLDELQPTNVKYDATPLPDVIKDFSIALEFNYLIDPQVKGAVNVTVNSEMTKREVWEMFEQILWLAGAYCSPEGKVLHILPFARMPQERRLLATHKPSANVEVVLLAVRNSSSKDILEKIKPFLTDGATAIDIPHQNSILLVEAPANIPKLETLLEVLDKKNKSNWPQAVIKCINISSSRVKDELVSILPVLGFPVTIDKAVAEPGSIHIASLERLQVLVASAANDEALEELRRWVHILDRSDVGDQERIFIYNVINGKADELTQALSVMFAVEGSTLSVKSSSSTGTSSGSTASASSTLNGAKKSNKDTGPASVFDIPVHLFADAVQNRLIIKTTPRTYAMVKALLYRIDTAATQVLLQVMVSEVTLTKGTEFGLEFSDKQGNTSNKVLSMFSTNYTSLSPADAAAQGFKYHLTKFSNPDEKFGFIRALAGQGKVEVLSSPQIVVKSHTQAKISVGDRVPIVTEEITDTASTTTSGTSVRRSIQYEDTGIILTITPHVTKGGLITIDLKQEVSDAIRNSTSDIDSPVIQERVIETSLSIRDGSTLIVAGLIRERIQDSLNSVPLISDIPVLGRLFGFSDVDRTKTEMVVMITGVIIRDDTKLEEMTRRYKEAMKAIKKLEQDNELPATD